MQLPRLPADLAAARGLPLWPPLLATRGAGGRSGEHAHHAMHLVVTAAGGSLEVTSPSGTARAAGVLVGPDVPHSIDATGTEVTLVFLDPESVVGAAFGSVSIRLISEAERGALLEDAEPLAIMRDGGLAWTHRMVATLGAAATAPRRIHPRVRRLLRLLPARGDGDTSLEALAAEVGLSPGRLMHVFTESIGIPLRPYLTWLKLQRAAGAISARVPLGEAAHAAGFADAAHMSRTFRRMLGVSPSQLRLRAAG